jgi:hypothetical protein
MQVACCVVVAPALTPPVANTDSRSSSQAPPCPPTQLGEATKKSVTVEVSRLGKIAIEGFPWWVIVIVIGGLIAARLLLQRNSRSSGDSLYYAVVILTITITAYVAYQIGGWRAHNAVARKLNEVPGQIAAEVERRLTIEVLRAENNLLRQHVGASEQSSSKSRAFSDTFWLVVAIAGLLFVTQVMLCIQVIRLTGELRWRERRQQSPPFT